MTVESEGREVSPRVRNPKGSGIRLREDIILAGLRVIDEGQDVTLRSVARQVGITAPAIYPHFSNLAALESELMTVSFVELAARVRGAIDAETDPVSALLAGCRAYVAFGWNHRYRYREMFSHGAFAENAMDTFTAAEEAIAACARAGVSASTDARADTYLLWLGLHGIATLDKPTRLDYLGLTNPGRPSFLVELVQRMAQLRPPARFAT